MLLGGYYQSLDYKTTADVYFAEEKKAFGYVDKSSGTDSSLRARVQTDGKR
jgi:hypothetical protein